MNSVVSTYSGKKTATIVGITYRQLDYWARTDLIRPSARDASGSGSRREYTYSDLLRLKVIKQLLDAGVKLEKIREVFEYVEEFGTDIAQANLFIQGEEVAIIDNGELISLIDTGQRVLFTVVSVHGIATQLDASIAEFAAVAPVRSPLSAPRSQTIA